MKKFLMVLAALVLGTTGATANDAALGLWKSEPGETGGYIHVQISSCGEKLCGEIIDVVENDNDTIIGEDIILNMKIRGDGYYYGGTIWAPDQDKTYRSNMTLNGDSLTVRGCVAFVLCRSQNWTRIE
jgi:uncharacterized protein (DUF2147 family)